MFDVSAKLSHSYITAVEFVWDFRIPSLSSFPPTLKAILHRLHGFPRWGVKPPLEAISSEMEEKVIQEFQALA